MVGEPVSNDDVVTCLLKELGYTIEEYVPSSSNNYEIEQLNSSKRMIAVVTVAGNFHFYMQHSDGTWSHKPGESSIINTSFVNDNSELPVILTNENIYYQTAKGDYVGGETKYFLINRPAVMDHSQTNSCFRIDDNWPDCNHSTTKVSLTHYREQAGDHLENAVLLSNSFQIGRFDYESDIDDFYFTSATSKTLNFNISVPSDNATIEYAIYNSSGALVTDGNTDDNSSFSFYVTAGDYYYLELDEYTNVSALYTITWY